MGEPGTLRRFLLESQPLRGHWTHLGAAWQELRARRNYPPVVDALLGEAATAAVLLTATLKFAGTLTLQLAGNGRVRLLVAQCTDDFQLRAVAHHDLGAGEVADFAALAGTGRLAVTVQPDASTAQYQGIVPLEGNDLGQCLERYFESSEQLPTRLLLAADMTRAGGMLVQKLPGAASGEGAGALLQSAWEDLQQGLRSLSPEILLGVGAEEAVRQSVWSARLPAVCRDAGALWLSVQRAREWPSLVRALGIDEARAALAEQGALTVTCEFCGRDYRYDSVDVEQLFAADGPAQPGPAQLQLEAHPLRGKTVVITGATSGIGEVAALSLAERGARIVLVARDPGRASATLRRLAAAGPSGAHTAYLADLSVIAEQRRVATEIAAAEPRIDVLINNAGALIMGRTRTADGLAATFALNHLAYYVLTLLLLPRLQGSVAGAHRVHHIARAPAGSH